MKPAAAPTSAHSPAESSAQSSAPVARRRRWPLPPVATLAALLLGLLVLAALFAPGVAPQNPHDPAQLDLLDSLQPPGSTAASGLRFWLGSDEQGRDMVSALMYGLRVSLFVAVTSALVAMTLGALAGLTAAFAGGRVDALLMRLVDLQLSFPAVLVALVLVATLGRGLDKTVIALIVVQWAYYARTVRGVALAEMRREYIDAAWVLGLPRHRILLQQLLPNCLAPVTVVAAAQVGGAIALEATLSFLGLGVPVTQPSLGLLIANGFQTMFSGRWWVSFAPGMALLVLVVCVNVLAEALRERFDPKALR
jgi:peptide/nickel transport system permease protein